MKDKKLLDLINNYLLFDSNDDKKALNEYIKNNKISANDYKKLSLVLLKKDFFVFVDCNKFEDIINNIDNDDFMNDEDNYILM